MSDSNLIYEISRKMNDKNVLESDLKEIGAAVREILHQKYIYKMQKELLKQKKEIQRNPTKEINLIKSLKPFMSENNQTGIDKMVEMITNVNVLKNIENDIISKQKYSAQCTNISNDESVKSDGIYDIDKECTVSKESSGFSAKNDQFPIIFLIMLLFMNN